MNAQYYCTEFGRKLLMYLFAHTKQSGKKSVFFISFSGKQYSDSPRAISEALHEMRPDVDLVWMGKEEVRKAAPSYVKVVENASMDALKAMARADVWVANTALSLGTYKHKRVFYVQTFHGDRGFKRCGYDAARTMGEKYAKFSLHLVENQICDVYMTGSEYGKQLAMKAYDYHGRFSEYGIPRNDRLIHLRENAAYAGEIKKSLGLDGNTKILLYAPTFRDQQRDHQAVNVDLATALGILSRNGEDWICLLRAHSNTKELFLGIADRRIIDVSDYKDMADLLLISDMLITDYSSSAPEFALTNRPVLLAQYDLEEYCHDSRTLAFDPKDSGFLIAENQEELNALLEHIDEYDHAEIRRKIDRFYGTFESGEATRRICREIIAWLDQ